MSSRKMLIAVMLATFALPVLANGYGEDSPYQFVDSNRKQYNLNAAIAIVNKKSGTLGTTYISNTAIGNQIIVSDNSSIDNTTIGQTNEDSQQNAVGAGLDDSGTVQVGAVIGGE